MSPEQQPTPVAPQSQGLAITALVLGILSIPMLFVFLLGIPLGITAAILGIVALAKKKPGKGMAIAGLVTGAVTVILIVPVIIFTTIVAYNGITERALESQRQAEEAETLRQQYLDDYNNDEYGN